MGTAFNPKHAIFNKAERLHTIAVMPEHEVRYIVEGSTPLLMNATGELFNIAVGDKVGQATNEAVDAIMTTLHMYHNDSTGARVAGGVYNMDIATEREAQKKEVAAQLALGFTIYRTITTYMIKE